MLCSKLSAVLDQLLAISGYLTVLLGFSYTLICKIVYYEGIDKGSIMTLKEAKALLSELAECFSNGNTPAEQDIDKYLIALSMAISVMFTSD